MQLMVDYATDSAKELELAGYFLLELSDAKKGKDPRAAYRESVVEPADKMSRADMLKDADDAIQGLKDAFVAAAPSIAASFKIPPPPNAAPVSVADDSDVDVEDDVTDVTDSELLPAAPVVVAPPVAVVLIPPPIPGPPAAPEYDKTGLPWDVRIHQDGRAMKLNGQWKNRKRLDPAIIAQVEAELAPRRIVPEGNPSVPAPVGVPSNVVSIADHTPFVPAPPAATIPAIATNVAPAAASVPPPPPTVAAATASVNQSVTVPPPPTNGAPPPPVANSVLPGNGSGSVTFKDLMTTISTALKAKSLSKEQLDAGLVSVGLEANQLGLLAAQPLLIPSMAAYINGILQ